MTAFLSFTFSFIARFCPVTNITIQMTALFFKPSHFNVEVRVWCIFLPHEWWVYIFPVLKLTWVPVKLIMDIMLRPLKMFTWNIKKNNNKRTDELHLQPSCNESLNCQMSSALAIYLHHFLVQLIKWPQLRGITGYSQHIYLLHNCVHWRKYFNY